MLTCALLCHVLSLARGEVACHRYEVKFVYAHWQLDSHQSLLMLIDLPNLREQSYVQLEVLQ
jgi:hypothetical protein